MDVVKTNIEKIGGSIELQSTLGHGTTFTLKVPLTLAIVPTLIVASGEQRYVIPQANLLELVRGDTEDSVGSCIELIHSAPVYRLRGRLLPIVDLYDVLQGGSGADHLARSRGEITERRRFTIVVLQSNEQHFGLIVDNVIDSQEIVAKPLGRIIGDVGLFAGATILGDGRVSLILDIPAIARRAGLVSESGDSLGRSAKHAASTEAEIERCTLLVVDLGADSQVAVPLDQVSRLEQFAVADIERSRGRDVLRYLGSLLPLIYLDSAVGRGDLASLYEGRDSIDVLVHGRNGRPVGVVVGRILDIVEEPLIDRGTSGYVRGTAAVHDAVTDVIDLGLVVESYGDEWSVVDDVAQFEELSKT